MTDESMTVRYISLYILSNTLCRTKGMWFHLKIGLLDADRTSTSISSKNEELLDNSAIIRINNLNTSHLGSHPFTSQVDFEGYISYWPHSMRHVPSNQRVPQNGPSSRPFNAGWTYRIFQVSINVKCQCLPWSLPPAPCRNINTNGGRYSLLCHFRGTISCIAQVSARAIQPS